MPKQFIQKIAKVSGKTEKELESLYIESQDIVTEEYGFTKEDEEFYPLVMGVFKNKSGIKDSHPLFDASTLRIVLTVRDIEDIKTFLDISIQQGGTPIRKLLSYIRTSARAFKVK
jgi:hypothetical protein